MNELIKLILSYNFWEGNKYKVLKEMFPGTLHDLYDLIKNSHEKFQRDLSIDEIKALYRTSYPVTTTAKLDLVFQALDTLPEIEADVAKEVLERAWLTEMGRQITEVGVEIVNGRERSFEKAKSLISKIEQGNLSQSDDFQAVSSELEDVLEAIKVNTKWKFHLDALQKVCGGTGPGIFTIIAGRVESGKSACGISLMAAPGGFADQGALVHYYANEESPQRLQARAIMCYTGMPLLEILNHPDKTKKIYNKVRDRLKFFNARDKSLNELSNHIEKNNPDIAIFDQCDKIGYSGVFAREDERLSQLYGEVRNIGSRTDTATFAITQLNAEAEGKSYISSANFSNSRTGKSAEADIAIGIGKNPMHDETFRLFNIIKSKLTGNHTDVPCILRSEISRYVD